MSEETWRPLGVDTEEQIAAYDALHDGVPPWMHASFWAWVAEAISVSMRYRDGSGRVPMLDTDLAEQMSHRLQISFPNLRAQVVDHGVGQRQINDALIVLLKCEIPLQIADYLLAHECHARPDDLNGLLGRSKSAWEVGIRSGRPGLIRRVPLGVQAAADSIMERAGRSGVRLAKAW
ncbi:hypothetical protein, partial [Streptomonospora salina]